MFHGLCHVFIMSNVVKSLQSLPSPYSHRCVYVDCTFTKLFKADNATKQTKATCLHRIEMWKCKKHKPHSSLWFFCDTEYKYLLYFHNNNRDCCLCNNTQLTQQLLRHPGYMTCRQMLLWCGHKHLFEVKYA